ncbi:hypothetical protein ACLOJK_038544 [Asimina triloba]
MATATTPLLSSTLQQSTAVGAQHLPRPSSSQPCWQCDPEPFESEPITMVVHPSDACSSSSPLPFDPPHPIRDHEPAAHAHHVGQPRSIRPIQRPHPRANRPSRANSSSSTRLPHRRRPQAPASHPTPKAARCHCPSIQPSPRPPPMLHRTWQQPHLKGKFGQQPKSTHHAPSRPRPSRGLNDDRDARKDRGRKLWREASKGGWRRVDG